MARRELPSMIAWMLAGANYAALDMMLRPHVDHASVTILVHRDGRQEVRCSECRP